MNNGNDINLKKLVSDFKESQQNLRDSLRTELAHEIPVLPGVTTLGSGAMIVKSSSLFSSKSNALVLSPFTYSVDLQANKISELLEDLFSRPVSAVRNLEAIASKGNLRTPIENFVFHKVFLDSIGPLIQRAIETGKELSHVLPEASTFSVKKFNK